MKKAVVYLILLFVLIIDVSAQLSQSQVEDFFRRFTGRTDPIENLFSTTFLRKVTVPQLAAIRDTYENKYGKYQKVELLSGNNCKVYYEKAVFPCTIAFDHSGLVSTLWFAPPSFANDKIELIKSDLEQLAGVVSMCVRKDGEEVYSLKKDIPLAVGSTFKLYVLEALIQKISQGRLHWNDTITIHELQKSLPTGILQNWPDGQALRINTVANLMISLSDNTAADMLIDKVGREYIEQFVPTTMVPFYKTKELFVLKLGRSESYLNWFVQADTKTKRLELEKMDTTNVAELNPYELTSPKHLEIEWLTTTEDLCKTIEILKGVPSLSINAGLVDKKDWYYVGFKGGSEPGVLNYTYLLQKKDTSPLYSISATVNDVSHVVDTDHEFTFIIKRIIDLIENNNP